MTCWKYYVLTMTQLLLVMQHDVMTQHNVLIAFSTKAWGRQKDKEWPIRSWDIMKLRQQSDAAAMILQHTYKMTKRQIATRLSDHAWENSLELN
jgi:hypothetical protein